MTASIFIDNLIEFLQHEFFMVLGGLFFYFFLIYSVGKNRGKYTTVRAFFQDQDDEIMVSLIGGLCFLIWDDETIEAITWLLTLIGSPPEEPIELQRFYYLLVGIFIDWIYEFIQNVPDIKKAIVQAILKKRK